MTGWPPNTQPYATIVTKNYPDDAGSDLDPPGRWRLNSHVSIEAFTDLIGESPHHIGQRTVARDYAAVDTLLPHPVYAAQSGVAVILPAEATTATVLSLVAEATTATVLSLPADAHTAARTRSERRP